METVQEEVLACANRVAGTSLVLSSDGDLSIDAFAFDSLTLFAFMLELESTFGVSFDHLLREPQQALTIRSLAALIESARLHREQQGLSTA
jgi:acyl carrier protein